MTETGPARWRACITVPPSMDVPDATATRGGTPLKPRVEGDVWVFEPATRAVRWEILPGTKVAAWTYNGIVPGPEIRVPHGQRVRMLVTNSLPDPTTVQWHGIAVPNAIDGVPGHGTDFAVVAKDGHPVPKAAQISSDVIQVYPASATTSPSRPPSRATGSSTAITVTTSPTTATSPGGLLLVVDVT